MSHDLLTQLQNTADRVGGCEPLWLKEQRPPQFKTVLGPRHADGTAGPELLLLHGLLGALSNWDTVFPLFGDYARPIALEFPILSGHRSEITIKALAAYTEYYIRQQTIGPVALCGNSLGGHVAMRLYFASPELVDCLILSGTSGLYEHSVDALPVRPDRKFIRDHMARVFTRPEFISDERIEEIYQIISSKKNVLNIIQAARSAKKDNLLKILNTIKVPVLLLWGADDQVTTLDVARTFAREIPNSRLLIKERCGHAPMIEYPEWFSMEVKQFLHDNSRYFKKG